jgi:hypothetical protein
MERINYLGQVIQIRVPKNNKMQTRIANFKVTNFYSQIEKPYRQPRFNTTIDSSTNLSCSSYYFYFACTLLI